MNKSEAPAIVGGLSAPSKMPGPGFSIPAAVCQVGAQLMKIKGSTCASCYAMKGRYAFDNVQNALYRRLELLRAALTDPAQRGRYVAAFEVLLADVPHSRWHDSGDLQSGEHLNLICDIARATPKTRHWLPTRERGILARYTGTVPRNLVIRLSAAMVDGAPSAAWTHTSSVHKATEGLGYVCPSSKQGNVCGACRACWNPKVKNVSYKFH